MDLSGNLVSCLTGKSRNLTKIIEMSIEVWDQHLGVEQAVDHNEYA